VTVNGARVSHLPRMHSDNDPRPPSGRAARAADRLYVIVGSATDGGLYDIVALGTVRAGGRVAALAAARLRWPARAAAGRGVLGVRPASGCRRTYLAAALAADAEGPPPR
jgi:hypothetical protein